MSQYPYYPYAYYPYYMQYQAPPQQQSAREILEQTKLEQRQQEEQYRKQKEKAKKKDRKLKEGDYMCIACQKSFYSQDSLNVHEKSHQSCQFCGFRASAKIIGQHVKEQHSNSTVTKKIRPWDQPPAQQEPTQQSLDSPDEIQQWIAARKRNWPTDKKIQEKTGQVKKIRTDVCPLFQEGKCLRGDRCPLDHILDESSSRQQMIDMLLETQPIAQLTSQDPEKRVDLLQAIRYIVQQDFFQS